MKITQLEYPNSRILLVRLSPTASSCTTTSSSPSTTLSQLNPSRDHNNFLPRFRPGQWIDLFLPGLQKPGGFTITSSPPPPPRSTLPRTSSSSSHSSSPHQTNNLELAVQKSPQNPAAAWLWRDSSSEIMRAELGVRVGGSFTWPPPGFDINAGARDEKGDAMRRLKRVVFVAGGVGIDPFMSMLSYIAQTKEVQGRQELGFEVVLLYTTKLIPETEGEILFLKRLRRVFENLGGEAEMRLFLTGEGVDSDGGEGDGGTVRRRRIEKSDLLDALGCVEDRQGTVCYVCGVPSMTDEFVEYMKGVEGMREENVLCERWW